METNVQNNEELAIDLLEILEAVLKKLWLVIVVGVVFSLVAMVGTKLLVTPTYRSTTKMYVLSNRNRDALSTADFQISTLLVNDYLEVVKSRTVVNEVIDKLDCDLTYEQLLSKFEVSGTEDTRIITIHAYDKDPIQARDIADALCDAASDQIKEVMNLEAVNVVDRANTPKLPYGPNIKKYGILAGLFGMCLVVFIIALRCILDDTIKSADDVEKYLAVGTLGVVPLSKNELEREKRHKKHNKKFMNKNNRRNRL